MAVKRYRFMRCRDQTGGERAGIVRQAGKTVRAICDELMVLYAGRIAEFWWPDRRRCGAGRHGMADRASQPNVYARIHVLNRIRRPIVRRRTDFARPP
jgi:hypothetical protein